MKRALFTTITNVGYYETIREDAQETATNWTISRHARPGDDVLLYDDPGSEWLGSYFADMHSLRMLDRPIKRTDLRVAFPDWRYWKQPRSSVRVPDEYVEPLRTAISPDRHKASSIEGESGNLIDTMMRNLKEDGYV